ncbi:MAG: AAA family ATPase [Candidatus Eiseniibacteriota bacterium]|nr:MAG: AAA family ATPase [Candidatus Eisenbacteria bacterium]
MRQISIYGKGGVGKSTVASNLSAALVEDGLKVMQVGCSPKSDSTYLLLGTVCEPTILNQIRSKGNREQYIAECLKEGYKGVVCAESGGPEPAQGCAGRGVLLSLDLLRKHKLLQKFKVEFVIYDVIADVVCGGFAQPMRRGFASEVYIVTSGELMSLYSMNNICYAVKTMNELKGVEVKVGGIINNMRGIPREEELVGEFCNLIKAPVVANIPRSELIQEAEVDRQTVVQRSPDSDVAKKFKALAEYVKEPRGVYPEPIDPKESIGTIFELLRKYQVFAEER